ncbi:hypothetical protein J416_00369 [Gracilibacillus halophilus YIM-C55.5]|uniref:Flagellar assembly factor FliW n=1 Tax=Gracilibacillus halophilus YIM-C55.5 TaxID=1308866 RepID=N4WVH0_9BACI|nr:flagellar assembly protein FliW [Gracilibacillus halophilus]ENH98395.1 hypothetical protein J416_00369 [Gracilibacillus halophilus YIM-C55.5]
MNIETKYFGNIEIKKEDIIHFPSGIPGFLQEKEFVLLKFEETGLFQVLQSIHGVDPAFIVVNPFLFVKDYALDLDDATVEQLGLTKQEDALIQAIVTINEPLHTSTANLQAPIVINQKNNYAKQYITNDKHYKTKEKIFNNTSQVKEG